jgi:hypothetical protein
VHYGACRGAIGKIKIIALARADMNKINTDTVTLCMSLGHVFHPSSVSAGAIEIQMREQSQLAHPFDYAFFSTRPSVQFCYIMRTQLSHFRETRAIATTHVICVNSITLENSSSGVIIVRCVLWLVQNWKLLFLIFCSWRMPDEYTARRCWCVG